MSEARGGDGGALGDGSARAERVACEAALATILGVDAATARSAAEQVVDRWPDVGLLTVAGVAAARWGVDMVPAIRRLAAGERLSGEMSAYEQRTAAEEVADDLESATARLAGALGDRSSASPGEDTEGDLLEGDTEAAVSLDATAPELSAVVAAAGGHRRWHAPQGCAPSALRRVRCLASRLGADLTTEGDGGGDRAGGIDPVGVGGDYVGFARLCGL